MDISGLFYAAPDNGKLIFQISRQLSENKILSGIIKDKPVLFPHLISQTMAQSAEALDINIHYALPRMAQHHLFLGLQGILIGHYNGELPVRLINRFLYDVIYDLCGLSASGSTDIKL